MNNREILKKFISTQGYKKNSPDVDNPFNIIPSGKITMKDVEFPVLGIDNLGNKILMQPGQEYEFPGDSVFELPIAQKGKQIPPPTRKDSLLLYNNTLNFEKKIKSLKYKNTYEKKLNEKDPLNLYAYNNNKIEINKLYTPTYKTELKENVKKIGSDYYLNSDVTRTGGRDYENYYIGYGHPVLKVMPNYKYVTTEQSSFLGYNTDLPVLLMDGRIKPHSISEYLLKDKSKSPDFVRFAKYDILGIKPFDLLTEKEKVERVKKFGTDGVPKSYFDKNNSKRDQIKPLSMDAADMVNPESEPITADTNIGRRAIRIPKGYKVTDKVNKNIGSSESSYTWFPQNGPLQELAPEPYNTRTMTPIYQKGGQINFEGLTKMLQDIEKRKQKPAPGPYRRKVNLDPNSEEYKNAYNDNNIFRYDKNTDTYVGRELDEVVLKGKPRQKGFWEQYRDSVVKEHQGDGPLGAMLGTPLDAVFGLPQKALTYAFSGKVQRPSDAMKLKNPVEATVVNVMTDPLTYVGMGAYDDAFTQSKNFLKTGIVKPGEFTELKDVLRYRFSNPSLPTELEKKLLDQVRNTGKRFAENTVNTTDELQTVLKNSDMLTDKQFYNLTGKHRSEIINQLEAGKRIPSDIEMFDDIDTADDYERIFGRENPTETLDPQEVHERLSRASQNVFDQPLSTITDVNGRIDLRRINNNNLRRENYDFSNVLIPGKKKNSPSIVKQLTKSLMPKGEPYKDENVQTLVDGLYASTNSNPAREILAKYREFMNAESGTQIIPSTSLSSDSFHTSYNLTPNIVGTNKADLAYHGMKPLNNLGFLTKAGVDQELILKEINSTIKNMNKVSPKKMPYGMIKDKQILYPDISLTKRKYGGMENKYQYGGGAISLGDEIPNFVGGIHATMGDAPMFDPFRAVTGFMGLATGLGASALGYGMAGKKLFNNNPSFNKFNKTMKDVVDIGTDGYLHRAQVGGSQGTMTDAQITNDLASQYYSRNSPVVSLTDEEVANKNGMYDGYAYGDYLPFENNNLSDYAVKGIQGLGLFNSYLADRENKNRKREYMRMLRKVGNTDSRNSVNPNNPFGNYTLNAGPGNNFQLSNTTPIQDFGTTMKCGGMTKYKQGGEYTVSEEELLELMRHGADIEFIEK